jgi:hypothetical protein
MDDSGVADAFYTLVSIAVVLVAAIAVSGVVLSSSIKQGKDAGARLSSFGDTGLKKGLYGFYYAVNAARVHYDTDDPNDIVLKRLVSEKTDQAIDLNRSSSPAASPIKDGAVIWSGYLYVPSEGEYNFQLKGSGQIWLWLDDHQPIYGSFSESNPVKAFTLNLSKGYRPLKLKFAYRDLSTSSCTLSWQQGEVMVPVNAFYR